MDLGRFQVCSLPCYVAFTQSNMLWTGASCTCAAVYSNMRQSHCRRDLQDASFFDRRPGGAAPAGELLGPTGPLAIKSAAQPPRQQLGAHSLGEAWKGETWRAPFKAPGTPGASLALAAVQVACAP